MCKLGFHKYRRKGRFNMKAWTDNKKKDLVILIILNKNLLFFISQEIQKNKNQKK